MVTEEEVCSIAKLAQLSLSGEEVLKFTHEFNKILDHMKELEQLDLKDVSPTSHGHTVTPAWRQDTVIPSPVKETVLQQSPEREGDYFAVPKVLA